MKIAPSLITVNLMLIRDTLDQRMVAYSDNDDFISQVNSLIESTKSLVNSVNIEIASDSDCPVEDREDWLTMQKATNILLNSYQTQLADFERDWKAHKLARERDYRSAHR